MTPGFADRYHSMIQRAVLPTADRQRIRSAAVVKGTSVISSGRHRVTLLMFVNVVTSAADSPQPRAGGSRLRVTMVQRKGSWVVDDVDAI
jgi:Mce-associated membrane protein